MERKPLSQRLGALLTERDGDQPPTLNEFLGRTEGEGIFVVIIILCLPFVAPVTPPGIRTAIGSVIILLTVRLLVGLPPGLPQWIGERPLPSKRFPVFVKASIKLVRFIERWIKPQGSGWIHWPLAHSASAFLIVFMAFLLALPLPIWLTNTLPAYAIVFLAASMMEGDCRMVWVGYGWSVISTAYFVTLAVMAWFFPKYYQHLFQYLKSWL